MNDLFFKKENCDRCGNKLTVRMLSWFTNETLCMDCVIKEDEIKKKLPNNGKEFEGCGYMPELKEK